MLIIIVILLVIIICGNSKSSNILWQLIKIVLCVFIGLVILGYMVGR